IAVHRLHVAPGTFGVDQLIVALHDPNQVVAAQGASYFGRRVVDASPRGLDLVPPGGGAADHPFGDPRGQAGAGLGDGAAPSGLIAYRLEPLRRGVQEPVALPCVAAGGREAGFAHVGQRRIERAPFTGRAAYSDPTKSVCRANRAKWARP